MKSKLRLRVSRTLMTARGYVNAAVTLCHCTAPDEDYREPVMRQLVSAKEQLQMAIDRVDDDLREHPGRAE